jgi:hypothetical protein
VLGPKALRAKLHEVASAGDPTELVSFLTKECVEGFEAAARLVDRSTVTVRCFSPATPSGRYNTDFADSQVTSKSPAPAAGEKVKVEGAHCLYVQFDRTSSNPPNAQCRILFCRDAACSDVAFAYSEGSQFAPLVIPGDTFWVKASFHLLPYVCLSVLFVWSCVVWRLIGPEIRSHILLLAHSWTDTRTAGLRQPRTIDQVQVQRGPVAGAPPLLALARGGAPRAATEDARDRPEPRTSLLRRCRLCIFLSRPYRPERGTFFLALLFARLSRRLILSQEALYLLMRLVQSPLSSQFPLQRLRPLREEMLSLYETEKKRAGLFSSYLQALIEVVLAWRLATGTFDDSPQKMEIEATAAKISANLVQIVCSCYFYASYIHRNPLVV